EVPMDDRLRAAVGDREIVIVGIRPDSFEDADTLDSDRASRGVTFEADVDVTEWLGEVLYAYIPFETHEAVRDQLEQLDRDLDGEGMRSQLIISLDSVSPVPHGARADPWFDTAGMPAFH